MHAHIAGPDVVMFMQRVILNRIAFDEKLRLTVYFAHQRRQRFTVSQVAIEAVDFCEGTVLHSPEMCVGLRHPVM
ncbi:hypothetical protein SRABI106_03983 [Rahnella aquatilis]|nr:hypothetical protein SRABI106_03983 [Rahnella aquatilis]